MWSVLDTTLCDKVGQILAAGLWSSPVTPVSSTDKAYNNISTIILTLSVFKQWVTLVIFLITTMVNVRMMIPASILLSVIHVEK
jgi:hypothetical protein